MKIPGYYGGQYNTDTGGWEGNETEKRVLHLSEIPPQGLAGMRQPSIISDLDASEWYLGEQLAKTAGKARNVDPYVQQFSQGIFPEDVYKLQKQEQIANAVVEHVGGMEGEFKEIAEQSAGMSDQEFEQQILSQMGGTGLEGQIRDMGQEYAKVSGERPKLQEPKLKGPDTLSLAITGLAAALNPQFSARILAAPFEGEMAAHAYRMGVAKEQHLEDLGAHEDRLQAMRLQLGLLQQEDERIRQRQSQYTDYLNSLYERKETEKAKAWQQYLQKPSEVTAARLRKLDPGFAPTPEQVTEAVTELNKQKTINEASLRLRATSEWTDRLNKMRDDYGGFDDDTAKQLDGERATFAKAYGIDPETLEKPTSWATLKDKEAKRKAAEFDEKLKYQKNKDRRDLAVKWANVGISKKRLEVAAYNAHSTRMAVMTGQFNANTNRWEAEQMMALRRYNADAKLYNDGIEEEVRDLSRELAGVQAQAKNAKGDDKAWYDGEAARIKAELDYLKSQKQELVPEPGLTATPQGGGAPQQIQIPSLQGGGGYEPGFDGPPGLSGNIGGGRVPTSGPGGSLADPGNLGEPYRGYGGGNPAPKPPKKKEQAKSSGAKTGQGLKSLGFGGSTSKKPKVVDSGKIGKSSFTIEKG